MKNWIYKPHSTTSEESLRLAEECNISPVTAAVALNRGLSSKTSIDTFINISAGDFHSPFLMKDMDKAVDVIKKAISSGKKITVYGDYDVDGITAVSILVKYLTLKGVSVSYYIPSRSDEGYGVNREALQKIRNDGAELVITVDTGITACNEIEFAKEIGLETVVTDHHQCPDTLPDCPVINPCRPDCEYPFKLLCGVGVVFKLLCALEGGNHSEIVEKYIDIVALGTIADVMSLEGENRIIVHYGLEKLLYSPNLGLKTLLASSGHTAHGVDVGTIGFGIAPRINAAGRIGDTTEAVKLLLSNDEAECNSISSYLNEENKNRQSTERSILTSVYKIIENDKRYTEKKVLIIAGTGWHHGIIGIVASRVTDKFNKPCILISCENGIGKGSGRSIRGFNLFDAVNSCSELFEKFGGHELAVGLTISQDNISAMEDAVNDYADKFMNDDCLVSSIEIDTELSGEYLNTETVKNLDLLEPYGNGNPKPIFSVCSAVIKDIRLMSEGKHIKFSLIKDNVFFDAVGFGKGDLHNEFIVGDTVDVAGILQINVWNNTKKLQLLLDDIKLCDKFSSTSPVPSRDDMAAVYRYLRKNAVNDVISSNVNVLTRKINIEYNTELSYEKLINCIKIFTEMKLATYALLEENADIYLLKAEEKVNLEESEILKKLRETEV